MKSLKNILCGFGLLALIAGPAFANEPTAPAGTDAAAEHPAEHHEHKAEHKTAKKGKKIKKTTTTEEHHKTEGEAAHP